jgi:AbrB family looped-hinge helix DNA binding protein
MDSVVSKLTGKGQLTLPKSVRDRLKLEKGSCIAFYLENNRIVMKKVTPKKPLDDDGPVRDKAGMFHDVNENEQKQANSRESKIKPIWEAPRWKTSL